MYPRFPALATVKNKGSKMEENRCTIFFDEVTPNQIVDNFSFTFFTRTTITLIRKICVFD